MTDITTAAKKNYFQVRVQKPVQLAPDTEIDLEDRIGESFARTLELNRLVELFFRAIRKLVDCGSIEYRNDRAALFFIDGNSARYGYSYQIKIGEDYLGEINFTCDAELLEWELSKIEELLSGFVFPLRNSLRYQEAIGHQETAMLTGFQDGTTHDSLIKKRSKTKNLYLQLLRELEDRKHEASVLRKQLNESNARLLRDSLTGAPNRIAFEERLALEINRKKRCNSSLCLAIWDIDYFKSINDTYGHDVGDLMLKHFSKVIFRRIREVDMFARIGGEEFALLMPDTSLEAALMLNNQLREILEKSQCVHNGNSYKVTASVGISDVDDLDTAATIVKKADMALYRSKQSGRNCCTLATGIEGEVPQPVDNNAMCS